MPTKKLFVPLLVIGLIASLVTACQPTPAAKETPAPAETAAAGEETTPEEVVIGVYEPLTGAFAAGGEFTMQGVNLAYKQKPKVLGGRSGHGHGTPD